ncbi:Methylthioribose-1-phosphate isomerase [Pseudonocardia sp. Ae168_Ps1]|uniref:S-methyl-5-thioribose-1-phosphate isomerase n=1 Tax=unclassified Pseudonocardia TaxID=2619320 RepID=UPI00094B57F5|nr:MULTISPECIES: S-methyl-5-thioribose-1-phosphate isomerase [unclassified Pseudonocardia]OLL71799.1 Methylthioribose-1-phosphate isomerase [Pseudonocardia sp. Ae150A_Ps1]OLL77766.1 Methylthioribose-1-phosphate isomerase [Pseudonocardia sp. Ae168_Ps1]OLL88110.1 Methylthioribose-1-phosphate isomerase [Pseudonocardia sp. Ae263_Ps1]OLL91864.1 Methylthioribose-1-phosphate isomerase [Pseudonocardia sp. Ae356_Ps1]
MRIVDWADESDGGPAVVLLDQRALPHHTTHLHLTTVDGVIDAVRSLAVRGAPSLGLAGAFGVALAAHVHGTATPVAVAAVRAAAERIATARPTAVPLSLGVRRALGALDGGATAVLAEARAAAGDNARTNAAAAGRAADLLQERCPDRPLRALTVCNTGPLATGAVGTALGAILRLHERGALAEVLACETRPLLQGARLTVWELARAGVPHRLCVDSAGPAAIAGGLVDVVLAGADRIAANGDVANKIGTYMLACAAARAGVPFVVVAPEETVDPGTPTGDGIVVEERDAAEVRGHGGALVTLPGTPVYNPAFDVTPHDLVTAVVTESRVWSPAPAASALRTAVPPR